ncbi:hypothetical protein OQJ13_00700 [Legionella sp. PATHC035]|uniref:hypothetical protein n=1 Tax=Legionella sp. PATHC035 TaxID=2992040 RepID=UPI002244BD8A|nr:hypothetical protein [Legionella sp. PATHC035]MCW8407491.1 hypothetical protein [Legionella sp. PATHC035]
MRKKRGQIPDAGVPQVGMNWDMVSQKTSSPFSEREPARKTDCSNILTAILNTLCYLGCQPFLILVYARFG